MQNMLLGTLNQGKVDEIRPLLANLPVRVITPLELGLRLEVAEEGATYAQNAIQKARAFAQASGMITLADDSGLEVAALGGQPGLHSARYVPGPGATDADRRRRLLTELAAHPRPWLARFFCVVAIIDPAGEHYLTEGICPGEIIPEERGQFGFGYDPIFYLPEKSQTLAELPLEAKNKLSHRARAVLAALPVLEGLLAG
jgi:XTP/dITP diphosphohydrolase